MILIKAEYKCSPVILLESDEYTELVNALEKESRKLEAKGILCISTDVSANLTRIDDFATEESGWQCALIICDSWGIIHTKE